MMTKANTARQISTAPRNSVALAREADELALGTDQNRKFVYVVSDDNLAKYREVKIGESIDGQRLILSGLEAGDKVITKGIAHIRPDMFVTAEGPEQKQAETEPVQATESKTEL